MLPLSILCRKRMPNQDSLGGYSFFKNLICRLSIEKEKTIRWWIILQGWKISRTILFQSTTVFQMNSLLAKTRYQAEFYLYFHTLKPNIFHLSPPYRPIDR